MFKCWSCDTPNYLSDLFVETVFVPNRNTRTKNDHLLNIPFAQTITKVPLVSIVQICGINSLSF